MASRPHPLRQYGDDPKTNGEKVGIYQDDGKQEKMMTNFAAIYVGRVGKYTVLKLYFKARGSREDAPRPSEPSSGYVALSQPDWRSAASLEEGIRRNLPENTVLCLAKPDAFKQLIITPCEQDPQFKTPRMTLTTELGNHDGIFVTGTQRLALEHYQDRRRFLLPQFGLGPVFLHDMFQVPCSFVGHIACFVHH
jgi:hypothetical protein